MSRSSNWVATVIVQRPTRELADRLEEALRPEAGREVPHSRVTLARRGNRALALEIRAASTGNLRAALNTYLGWVDLAVRSERVAAPDISCVPP